MSIKVGQLTYNSTASVATQPQVPGLLVAPGANASSVIVPFSRNNAPAQNSTNASSNDGSNDDQNGNGQVSGGASTNSAPAKNIVISFSGNSQTPIGLANPAIATPLVALLTAGAVFASPAIISAIKKPSSENIDYTKSVFQELFSTKELSPERRKEVLNNLIKFATNPESIVVPARFLNMHPTPALREKAALEYRKAAQKVASIFLFFPMKFLTDLDGTFISYKAADFVSGTGVCASVEDRESALTFIYLLNKLNLGLKDYYQAVHGRAPTPDELRTMKAGFNALSMRGVLFGGVSIYGSPGKSYRIADDGKLIIDQRSSYGHSEISAFPTELGFGTGIVNTKGLQPFDIMNLNGFGGLVAVTEGKYIEIKDSLKTAAKNMKEAIHNQTPGWEAHYNRLLNYRGEEFLKEYEAYLSGNKQDIKMGYLHEMCLFAHSLGLQVFENKSMPSYMMDKEWSTAKEKPRYDHYMQIAELIQKAADGKNQNWKTLLKNNLTPLSKNESSKLVVSTALYNQIDRCRSLGEFFEKFSEGSPIIITVHAINGQGNFKNPQKPEYDFYKQLIQKLSHKYSKEFQVANNGASVMFDQAPYLEVVGGAFEKGDVVVPEEYSYSVGAGDSQATDTRFITRAINQAFAKEKLVRKRLEGTLKELSKITGTDHTNLSAEQKERLVQSAIGGLGIAPRGQIDLGNKVAISHYAVNGAIAGEEDGPFALQEQSGSYKLIGKCFGEYQGKIVSQAEFRAVVDKKANKSNLLYKVLEEKAVPFYKDKIARFADVHQHGQFWAGIMSDIFGIDKKRIDSQTLYNLIVPPETQIDRYTSSLFQLTDTHQKVYNKVFNLQPQKNPYSVLAKTIFNAPNIGSSLALMGATMSAIGVAGKLYDTASHDNRLEASFGDIIAKGFSLANLGLAFSTVLLKTQFYPFQLLGSLIGITSGFLPAGNIQQYLALGSMSLSLLGSARESGFSNGSRIDAPTAASMEKMKQIFNKKDGSLKSGPAGAGPTYLDLKVPISDGNIWAETLHENMIKWLYNKFKLNPKVAECVSKPVADISWNARELWRAVKNPSLLRLGSFQSATNGIEYHYSPVSTPHLFNAAGFASLGLLGVTAALQAYNYFSSKRESDDAQKGFIETKNAKFDRNIRFLLDPRAKTKIINKQAAVDSQEEDDQALKAKVDANNLSKVAYTVGAVSSLIPALVFLVQGLQIRQNALATRRSYTDPMGKQVIYMPGAIGSGLAIASGLQGLAAVGSGLAGSGLMGSNPAMALNTSQGLYNLFAAFSLAFSGLNIGGGGGGANLTMRNASVALQIDQESCHTAKYKNTIYDNMRVANNAVPYNRKSLAAVR
jgi:hypothetical protein